MRNKIQQEDNTPKAYEYQLMLPFDVGVRIEASESVRSLLEITERMDYRKLEAAYDRLSSADEASPKQMFQLTILGFLEDMYSTRKLEKASKNDIRFMYLLAGKPAPDHNRFWSFIKKRMQGEAAEHLFYQLTEHLGKNGEIDFTNLFVDGTKIEAQANRYSFVWKKSTNKYEARLDEKLRVMIERLPAEYGIPLSADATPEAGLKHLKEKARKENIPFVHGRGKRKTPLQRDIETLESYKARKTKYAGYNDTFKGRNSFSKTDPDATFMRMKEDHMGST